MVITKKVFQFLMSSPYRDKREDNVRFYGFYSFNVITANAMGIITGIKISQGTEQFSLGFRN
jgi:hypothetical protein